MRLRSRRSRYFLPYFTILGVEFPKFLINVMQVTCKISGFYNQQFGRSSLGVILVSHLPLLYTQTSFSPWLRPHVCRLSRYLLRSLYPSPRIKASPGQRFEVCPFLSYIFFLFSELFQRTNILTNCLRSKILVLCISTTIRYSRSARKPVPEIEFRKY